MEVYQWVEHREEEEQEGESVVHYRYTKEWSPVNQGSNFADDPESEDEDAKTRNMSDWPFQGDTFDNEQLNMGAFKVSRTQISRMNEFTSLDISGRADAMADAVQQAMFDKGCAPLHQEGEWLTNVADGHPRVNDIRVRWEVVHCQEYTFLSQQMKDNKGEWTFRKWKPEEIEAEWGTDTS